MSTASPLNIARMEHELGMHFDMPDYDGCYECDRAREEYRRRMQEPASTRAVVNLVLAALAVASLVVIVLFAVVGGTRGPQWHHTNNMYVDFTNYCEAAGGTVQYPQWAAAVCALDGVRYDQDELHALAHPGGE